MGLQEMWYGEVSEDLKTRGDRGQETGDREQGVTVNREP